MTWSFNNISRSATHLDWSYEKYAQALGLRECVSVQMIKLCVKHHDRSLRMDSLVRMTVHIGLVFRIVDQVKQMHCTGMPMRFWAADL